MKQGLHRLIRPLGNLCLGADRRAGVVLVGRQSGEAAELTRILEARKASGDGDHVDGDSFPDSVYALQQLLLSVQYRICGDERINLLINDLYLLVYDLYDLLPAFVFMFEIIRGHILLLVCQLRLIPLPVREEKLPVGEQVFH